MKAVEDILPRTNPEAKRRLDAMSLAIEKSVIFGTNILKWDIESAVGRDEQAAIQLSLRHFIEIIDAISILVGNSSINPCKNLLRGALESYMGLEYMFEQDTEQRALAFLICDNHKKYKVYQKFDPTTERGKQLKSQLKNDHLYNTLDLSGKVDLEAARKNLDDLFTLSIYSKVEEEYQRITTRNRPKPSIIKALVMKIMGSSPYHRSNNPNWYSLFGGPKNVEQLARHVHHTALYEVLYRSWSGVIHGTDILGGVLMKEADGRTSIKQIRLPYEAQSIASWALNLSLMTYKSFILHRLPHKETNFDQWYDQELKTDYLKITSNDRIIIEG